VATVEWYGPAVDEEREREAHICRSPWVAAINEVGAGVLASRGVKSLRQWREDLEQADGCLKDPIGAPRRISLAAWAGHDADETKLEIKFELPPTFDRRERDDIHPGSVYAGVLPVDPSDPRSIEPDVDGRSRVRGATLRAIRAALDDGGILDHEGNAHQASLEEWKDADPDTTWLAVGLYHQQSSAPWGLHGSRWDWEWHWRAMDSLDQDRPSAS
jgi:hypothetical protein